VLAVAAGEGTTPAEPAAVPEWPDTIVVAGRTGATSFRSDRPLLAIPVERLSPAAQRRMWSAAMPELSDDAQYLAGRYPVEPSVAAEAAADLRLNRKYSGIAEVSADDVSEAIRARSGLMLSGGVKLIRPRASWKDLVLSPQKEAQLREAVKRLELQSQVLDDWGFLGGRAGSRGVRMLFTGQPGTGKTLTAEVMAGELKADLLFVDISRVVSKWIGETEKHLAAVFDTAERAHSALFFDEADALFGRRTEISDAHDRYANLETAYLLARLERFDGLAILATNLRQNIDVAFVRRMEFVIDFEEPDTEERHRMWRCHIPPDAELAKDVNLFELASLYPVVGGIIRNAAAAAAFLAAADGEPISRLHLIRAIRREYEKGGKSFPGVPLGMRVS
jgi:SpoVK/Ycf46/Vps4 family AAA+-type ATPase